MLEQLEDMDVVETGKALESVYKHFEASREMAEILEEYDSIDEILENENEKITEIREAAEDSYITQLYIDAERELQSAYDAADWT